MPKRVLVVEDDATIRDTLSFNLEKEGYAVTVAQDGADGVAKARSSRPDLILLDLMLPELNGLEVCRILRQEGNVPIIMLTAKESEVDKVIGLQLGADDYITKPFSLRELFARMTAVLRRSEQRDVRPEVEEDRLGRLRIDRAGRRAMVDDSELKLTPKEWASGHDPQLEKAVALVMDSLKKNPLPVAKRPVFPNYHNQAEQGVPAAAGHSSGGRKK